MEINHTTPVEDPIAKLYGGHDKVLVDKVYAEEQLCILYWLETPNMSSRVLAENLNVRLEKLMSEHDGDKFFQVLYLQAVVEGLKKNLNRIAEENMFKNINPIMKNGVDMMKDMMRGHTDET